MIRVKLDRGFAPRISFISVHLFVKQETAFDRDSSLALDQG
jgi:hypothetical protein